MSGQSRHHGEFTAVLLGLGAATVGVAPAGLPSKVPIFAILTLLALGAGALAASERLGLYRVTPLDVSFLLYIIARAVLEVLNEGPSGRLQMTPVADLLISYAAIWAVRLAAPVGDHFDDVLRIFAATSIPVSLIGVLQLLRIPELNEFL